MASNEARVIPLRREARAEPGNTVVAVVLADGRVRRVDGAPQDDGADFENGQISGDEWVLWWQRRSFGPR